MKVLLLKDVYKLGRAGEVKKVAAGYGRNYLIPQGLAMIATKGAAKMAERIRTTADKERAVLNEELSGVAEKIDGTLLRFPARASETGRLYGSINTRMLAEAISEEIGMEIKHTQIETQPLRILGEHTVNIRLTVDLIPEIKVVVYREGEALEEVADVEDVEGAEGEAVDIIYTEEGEMTIGTTEDAEDTEAVEGIEEVDDFEDSAGSESNDDAADAEAVEGNEEVDDFEDSTGAESDDDTESAEEDAEDEAKPVEEV